VKHGEEGVTELVSAKIRATASFGYGKAPFSLDICPARTWNNVLRTFGQLICTIKFAGQSAAAGSSKGQATGPIMPTCALGVTCDARCSLRLRRLDAAGSGFHPALPEQPRESGDRPSSRILGST
jgi:hypothetical protein